MVVRELVTRLGFQADPAQANRYNNALRSIRRVAVAATAAVTALGGAAAATVNSTAQAASETLQWANRLGLTTEELSRLQFAASQYGVQQDAVVDGLKELSLRTDEFVKTGKGPGVDAFNSLGLSAQELNAASDDTAALFELVRSRVDDIQNAAERQRVVDELFGGQAGEQFAEFLSISTSEFERLNTLADELGVTISGDLARDSRSYTRQIGRLQAVFTGLRNTIGGSLLPIFSDFLLQVQEFLLANRQIIAQRMQTIFSGVASAISVLSTIIGGLLRAVNSAVTATIGWESALGLLVRIAGAFIALRVAQTVMALVAAAKAAAASTTLAAAATKAWRIALLALQRVGILALLTLMIILIEDVITWINGGDSAIGRWIGSWEDFKTRVREVVSAVVGWVNGLIEDIKGVGRTMIDALTLDKDQVLESLRSLGSSMVEWALGIGARMRDALLDMLPGWMVDALRSGGDLVSSAVESGREAIGGAVEGGQDALGSALDTGREAAGNALDFARGFFGGNENEPSGNQVAQDMGRNGGQRSVNVNARTEATLQVPQGTSAEQRAAIEQQAEQIFSEHWEREMRRSMFDFQPVE